MKADSTREKRDRSCMAWKQFATACVSLLMMLILTGAVFGESPGFFTVDTESRFDTAPEAAVWMASSSCSGTCFHGPVMLTSEVIPVQSAQSQFGQFAGAYIPTAEQESGPNFAVSPAQDHSARQTVVRPGYQVGSAQNRFGTFYGAPQSAVPVAQSGSASAADRQMPPRVLSSQGQISEFPRHAEPAVNEVVSSRQGYPDPVSGQQSPSRSGYGLDSAQTPFGQQALGYQTTVRLVQNVDELQPVDVPRAEASNEEDVSEAESLGSAPENVGIQFLRTQTVLLKPCQWQFDAGLNYTIAESDFPVAVVDAGGNVIGVSEGRIRQRLLLVPFEARYGLTSRIQLFASAPVGYSNTEFTAAGADTFTDTGGIGDVSFGLSAQLVPGSSCRPELIGTLGVTSPTGDASLANTLLSPEANLGEGFWGFTGNLLWVRNYDPVVVFYGVGANFRLDAELDGVDVDPGERFLYQFGVGFAVNRHVTLSTALIGSYWVEDRWDGVRVPGGIREPLRLRFAATIGKSCRLVEPFAEIGMTEDAPSSRIGITWTF